jgi:hypothetical protein
MPGGAFYRFKMFLLITTLLAYWLLGLAAVGTVSYKLYSRHDCPPGQTREQFFGHCLISKSTVKKLVREVQRRTVEDVCQDLSWFGASTGTHTYTHTHREKTPRYDLNDIWGGTGMIDFPWKDLEMHSVEREWQEASDLHSAVFSRELVCLASGVSSRALVCLASWDFDWEWLAPF